MLALLSLPSASSALAEVPRVPFSGVYGATAGAGSLTGWDRHGGDNPAVLGLPGWSGALSGYSPFGLDGLRVVELEAVRDAARWGASAGWRALFDASDDGGSGSSAASGALWRVRGAWKPSKRWSGGASLSWRSPSETFGIANASRASRASGGAGAGLLWHPHRFVSWGAAWEAAFLSAGTEQRAGLGMDMGARFASGYAWRVSVERFQEWGGAPVGVNASGETRYGFGFQFHRLLGVYAGLSPRHESAALGLRFGMGNWEGFSALRRHAALGGTSIQGLQWRSRTAETKGL